MDFTKEKFKKEVEEELKKYYKKYKRDPLELRKQLLRIRKGEVCFIYKKADDFNFWVKEYYSKKAKNIKVIENILKDDETINYKVLFNIEDIDYIFNTYVLNSYNNYIAIKNCPLNEILDIVSEGFYYNTFKIHNIDMIEHYKIFEEIMKTWNLSKEATILKLRKKYLNENQQQNILADIICSYYRIKYFDNSMTAIERAYETRDKVIREILNLRENTNLKNVSELTLYKLIRDEFNDAIYQYKNSWLGKQSLDIYIPSKKIAIEYQGQQHYQPVDIFGGKSAFKHQQELDNQKRNLCKNNDVKLFEWKYDKEISQRNIKDLIKTLT